MKNLLDLSYSERITQNINDLSISFIEKSFENYSKGLEDIMNTFGLSRYFLSRIFDGGIVPTVTSLLEIERDITDGWLQVLYGQREFTDYYNEISNRVMAGSKYEKLMNTYGKELFGSAKFDGEKVLAQNNHLILYYIPPKNGVTPNGIAIFHAGGILPYSDKIFRFLPEANFFERFTEKGFAIYSVELNGDKDTIKNYGELTLEKYVDYLDEFSKIAFEHNGKQKMIIEGYCGLVMQAYAFLMAKPEVAEERFKAAMTFVAPIDGRKCEILAEIMIKMPQNLLLTHFTIANLLGGGVVSGDSLRRTQDIALRGFFPKTKFGRFITGWKAKDYANVNSIEDLTPAQRKDLAGAYWISAENCNRYPVPVDLARYSARLFRIGIADNGDLPYTYKGKKLSFADLYKKTGLKLIGFYGAKDRLVPHQTAEILNKIFKDRYIHIVHENAGHISYVLSPEVWDKNNKKALVPNPIEEIVRVYNS